MAGLGTDVGYTDDLDRRLNEHWNGKGAIFTKKYSVIYLIYYEEFKTIKEAKSRER